MRLTSHEKFVQFIEQYPECYSIAESEMFLKFLRAFAESPKALNEFKVMAPNIEEMDIKLIILALESAKLIKKTTGIQKEVYYPTSKAKKLLTLYNEAKNE